MNRTDRLLGILLELQARGVLRAEDLARRFEVSLRTVYRDVQALSETGVPVVAIPGQGYRLMEGYFLPPLSFTAPEAALLLLGGEFVREQVDPELRQVAEGALTRLAGVVPPALRAEVDRRRQELHFPAFGSPGEGPRLSHLRAAVEQRRVLRLLYHTYRRPHPEPRTVEPYMLVHMTRAWHLAAYCRLRQAPRLFRLDRIDHLEPLPERFTLAERHRRRPEWEQQAGEGGEARVRFDPSVVRWVRERQLYLFRREEPPQGRPESPRRGQCPRRRRTPRQTAPQRRAAGKAARRSARCPGRSSSTACARRAPSWGGSSPGAEPSPCSARRTSGTASPRRRGRSPPATFGPASRPARRRPAGMKRLFSPPPPLLP